VALFIKEGEYVPSKEAARIIGVSRERVRYLVDMNKLPAVRSTNMLLISLDAVLEHKREREERMAAKEAVSDGS
jgi:excisionase family DNA binding protein